MYKKHSFEEKLRCMRLLDEGYPLRRLSKESGILRNQLRDLRKRYLAYGEDGLRRKPVHYASEAEKASVRAEIMENGEHESAKSDVNRKRFNKMLKYVMDKKNRIDAVIVYSTSRFSRTGTKSFSIVDELMERGIPIFSATSNYDARTTDGKMLQGIELLVANHTNNVNSQTVRDNGARALRNGRWIQAPPRGYDMKTTRSQ